MPKYLSRKSHDFCILVRFWLVRPCGLYCMACRLARFLVHCRGPSFELHLRTAHEGHSRSNCTKDLICTWFCFWFSRSAIAELGSNHFWHKGLVNTPDVLQGRRNGFRSRWCRFNLPNLFFALGSVCATSLPSVSPIVCLHTLPAWLVWRRDRMIHYAEIQTVTIWKMPQLVDVLQACRIIQESTMRSV